MKILYVWTQYIKSIIFQKPRVCVGHTFLYSCAGVNFLTDLSIYLSINLSMFYDFPESWYLYHDWCQFFRILLRCGEKESKWHPGLKIFYLVFLSEIFLSLLPNPYIRFHARNVFCMSDEIDKQGVPKIISPIYFYGNYNRYKTTPAKREVFQLQNIIFHSCHRRWFYNYELECYAHGDLL